MKRTIHSTAPGQGALIDPFGPNGARVPAGVPERVLHSPDR
ncbi:hypothetical protein [Streptomyces triticiradicis]|nr:hypothetical protein [Streptomyces triticiradicis]